MQFSDEFAKMQYSSKSKPALQQLISLLLLDIALLLGCADAIYLGAPSHIKACPETDCAGRRKASDDGDITSSENEVCPSPAVGLKGLEPGCRDDAAEGGPPA